MLPIYMALIDDDDDISAFEILYKECKSKAYIIAYNILKNESLAEECVSEVFFSVAKNFKKVNNLTSYEKQKYVVISVRNKAFNILTKEKNNTSNLPYEDIVAGYIIYITAYDEYDNPLSNYDVTVNGSFSAGSKNEFKGGYTNNSNIEYFKILDIVAI